MKNLLLFTTNIPQPRFQCLRCGPIVVAKANVVNYICVCITTPQYSSPTLDLNVLEFYSSHPWIKNLLSRETHEVEVLNTQSRNTHLNTSTRWESDPISKFRLQKTRRREAREHKWNRVWEVSLRRCSSITWSSKLESLLSVQPSTSVTLRKPISSTTNAIHSKTWNLVPKISNSITIKRWCH